MAESTAHRHRWAILFVVLAAECMDLLDATIVNLAAPALKADLHTTTTQLQWIVGGYALAIAVGLIAGGRLGDLLGRRTMFLTGVVGFTTFSLACGLAPNSGSLIGFRLAQGLLAAVMLPQGLGIIREVFPADETGKAFALFGPVIGGAAVLGPIVGGALVDWNLAGWTWRLVFFVNVPLGLATILAGALLLPRTTRRPQSRLDLVGALLSGAACVALTYPLVQGRDLGWPWWSFAMMAGALVLFGIFAVQQRSRVRRSLEPLVLPTMLARRGYTAGLVVMMFFFCGMGGLLLAVSVFLQTGQGFTPIHAGVVLIPMSLGMAVGAGLSGAVLAPRLGRGVLQAGAAVSILGWATVALTVAHNTTSGALALLPGLFVSGFGTGLVVAPMFDVILASVTHEETGSASGLLNAVQQLAGAVGVAVLGTVFFSTVEAHGFRVGLERTVWVQIGAQVAMLAVSPLLPRKPRAEAGHGAAPAPELIAA